MTWLEVAKKLLTADQDALFSMYKGLEGIMISLDELETKASKKKIKPEEIEKISDSVRDEMDVLWYCLDDERRNLI